MSDIDISVVRQQAIARSEQPPFQEEPNYLQRRLHAITGRTKVAYSLDQLRHLLLNPTMHDTLLADLFDLVRQVAVSLLQREVLVTELEGVLNFAGRGSYTCTLSLRTPVLWTGLLSYQLNPTTLRYEWHCRNLPLVPSGNQSVVVYQLPQPNQQPVERNASKPTQHTDGRPLRSFSFDDHTTDTGADPAGFTED